MVEPHHDARDLAPDFPNIAHVFVLTGRHPETHITHLLTQLMQATV
jgi:hypothetical protein